MDAQIQQLLGGAGSGIDMSFLGPVLILSSIASVLIIIMMIMNAMRKWKVDSAILHMAKDMKEMNERQKGLIDSHQAQKAVQAQPVPPAPVQPVPAPSPTASAQPFSQPSGNSNLIQ